MGADERKPGWMELPSGGLILDAGSAERYMTGGWRTFRPILDGGKCTDCMICWFYCPDTAIVVRDGIMQGFDLVHCKGCGICAAVCPPKTAAIVMLEEAAAKGQYGTEGVTPRLGRKAKAGSEEPR